VFRVVWVWTKKLDGMKKCKLLSGQFAILVQFILAFICFLTLAIKWHFERPKRAPTVWILDGTKQGIGSITGHMANIFLSTIIAHSRYHHTVDENHGNADNGDEEDDDECKWYLMNYLSDSTFGIIFNILILKLLSSFIHSFSSPSSPSSPAHGSHSPRHLHHRHPPHRSLIWFQFGYYGNPISLSIWFIQLLLWLLIVLCGKFLTFLIFYLISNEVNALISPAFLIFKGYPKVELIVVMILIPFLLNSVQFWIQDSYLMIDPTDKDEDDDEKVQLLSIFFPSADPPSLPPPPHTYLPQELSTRLLAVSPSSHARPHPSLHHPHSSSLAFQPITPRTYQGVVSDKDEDWAL
jgi:hypothetical protein